MLTSLDLLVILVMALAAVSLVSIALMFLVKNDKVRRVCFYIVTALALYMGAVGIHIMFPDFLMQLVLSIAMILVTVVAVVLEWMSKDNAPRFLLARVLATAALVVGMMNALT